MTWNYRIIDFGEELDLCEVYYDDHGKPGGYRSPIFWHAGSRPIP